MAIVVDPDNADRVQIIFGSENRLVSIFPVGALVDTSASGTTGVTTGSTTAFSDAGQDFNALGVVAGDILCLFNGNDAAHYVINGLEQPGLLNITSASFDGHNVKTGTLEQTFTGDTALLYQIRDPLTGSVVDGITKQALYSFGKEEWRVDSNVGSLGGYADDLIRHHFPYEAITSEQFEIGGGASHANWSYFNDFTRKKIRTGGWADLLTAGGTLEEWTGIITLGSLPADTQVYYQPLSASADPVDFDFLGAVNEPIEIFSGSFDTRGYLKIFARKKGQTYNQSEISDIGVTSIQTIVNRFPVGSADDPAIVALDGAISGTAPWRTPGAALESGAAGSTANVDDDTGTLTDGTKGFDAAEVKEGDRLSLTDGNNVGNYTIVGVAPTILTVVTTADPVQTVGTGGPFETAGSISYSVTTTLLASGTNGGIADIDIVTGLFEDTTALFADTVDLDDILIIKGPTPVSASFIGAYKIVTASGETQLTIDTTDQLFFSASDIEWEVRQPGMYLQQKNEDLGAFDAGTLHFSASTPPAILRNTGNWVDENVSAGSVLNITNTTSNNDCFTVATVSTTTATLVATDTVIEEVDTTGSIQGTDYFKRAIQGVTYGFQWRLFGNDSTLDNHYQFVQHQLRQPTDIDFSESVSRGDVTDLLMSFATPTATTFNMFIDDLANVDLNNVTFRDACGEDRVNAFVAAGTITFNSNLQGDGSAVYRMFFTNNDAGDNDGSDYGTPGAIIVLDSTNAEITGTVGGAPSVAFTYDYDNNVQRGTGSDGTDAPVTVVAIGLVVAQFVLATAIIEQSKTNIIGLVSALERNYSNP